MSKKRELIDMPGYEAGQKVAFPPTQEEDYMPRAPRDMPDEMPRKEPYTHTYEPETPAPDPSQTTPGAPDIRDPDVAAGGGIDAATYSPDPGLKK